MIDFQVDEAYKYLWLGEVRGTVFAHSRVAATPSTVAFGSSTSSPGLERNEHSRRQYSESVCECVSGNLCEYLRVMIVYFCSAKWEKVGSQT